MHYILIFIFTGVDDLRQEDNIISSGFAVGRVAKPVVSSTAASNNNTGSSFDESSKYKNITTTPNQKMQSSSKKVVTKEGMTRTTFLFSCVQPEQILKCNAIL